MWQILTQVMSLIHQVLSPRLTDAQFSVTFNFCCDYKEAKIFVQGQ